MKIIKNIEEFSSKNNHKIVMCFGHFNAIHPGHIQYLEYSKKLGNKLLIAVKEKEVFGEESNQNYFSLDARVKGVSSLNIVDFVLPLKNLKLIDVIKNIKPEIFVLGKEHEKSSEHELKEAIKLLLKNNGKMIYFAGTHSISQSEYLFDNISNIEKDRIKTFLTSCKSQNINLSDLINKIKNFSKSSLLVLGDTIVDQYIDCNALGMSSEAPVIVVQEKESKNFLGGAAIVASHVKSLGAECKFISVTGNDEVKNFVKKQLDDLKINSFIIQDENRPTTFKTRYLVDKQKVFRVSRLNEETISNNIEDLIISTIEKEIDKVQGILISDFVYGVISPKILKQVILISKKKNKLIFGDLQCSSQVGDIKKFYDFDLICPTEKEARIALNSKEFGIEWVANKTIEKTRSKHLIMKLGAEGFITYETKKDGFINKQYFPALNVNPLDVTGAGDSLIAALSVGLCSGMSLMESSAIGAMIASIAVQNMGNLPVGSDQLVEYIRGIKLYE